VNVRKTNLTLRSLTATFVAGAAIAAVLGLVLPVDVAPPDSPDSRRTARAASSTSPAGLAALESFEPVMALHLRRPLTDTPSATATQPGESGTMAAGAGGPFVLLGTIGDSLAMIRTSSGLVEVKAVGEQAGGARIVAIRPSQVDIDVAGERRTLVKPREGGGG
jgi:hypothetical protein